ncbi:hypothetical protein GCM10025787_31310 [Saccharopolyspora rosea]|uniref:Uncharacterized protein n=1 Tax=Saccharopolyspora rosea TaxID=524884 RepID=A0ABW3FWF1_9PSEU
MDGLLAPQQNRNRVNDNSISVAEHAVMQILALVRNFLPAHNRVAAGGWNIADSAARAYDLEHGRRGGGSPRAASARR